MRCRQGVIELTAVVVRFRGVGAEQESFCGRVGKSAAALRFVWACQGSGQTDICFDDWLIEGAAGLRGMHGFCIFMHCLRSAGFLPSRISGLLLLISPFLLLLSFSTPISDLLSLTSYLSFTFPHGFSTCCGNWILGCGYAVERLLGGWENR